MFGHAALNFIRLLIERFDLAIIITAFSSELAVFTLETSKHLSRGSLSISRLPSRAFEFFLRIYTLLKDPLNNMRI
jgi:hypothetical protein